MEPFFLALALCAATGSASHYTQLTDGGLGIKDVVKPAAAAAAAEATCPAGSAQCSSGAFPSNFCCPTGDNCLSLAAQTTILCCPGGGGCNLIVPVSCDLSLQNATTYPDAPIKTTFMGTSSAQLPHCGDGRCCPWGYACSDDNNQCQLQSDQSVPPPGFSASPAPAASPTASSSPTTTSATHSSKPPSSSTGTKSSASSASASPSRSTSASADTSPADSEDDSSGPGAGAIAGGVIGALSAVGALAGVMYFFNRGQSKKNGGSGGEKGLLRQTSSFGNIISAPIAPRNSTLRTDFGRKPPSRPITPADATAAAAASAPAASRFETSGDRPPPSRSHTPVPLRNPFDDGTPSLAASSRRSSRDTLDLHPLTAMYRLSGDDGHGYGQASAFDRTRRGGGGGLSAPPAHPPVPPVPMGRTLTPQRAREPSEVSINVFAEPDMLDRGGFSPESPESPEGRRPLTAGTTFSGILKMTGLEGVGHEVPFVPADAYAKMPAGPQEKGKGNQRR